MRPFLLSSRRRRLPVAAAAAVCRWCCIRFGSGWLPLRFLLSNGVEGGRLSQYLQLSTRAGRATTSSVAHASFDVCGAPDPATAKTMV